MPRLMSVAFTEPQVRDRTKTVTRRVGWWEDKNGRRILQVGARLTLVRKSMGRKPGEPLVRITDVEIVRVTREPLGLLLPEWAGCPKYGIEEMKLEGFPGIDPGVFVHRYFITAQGIAPDDLVTRIEWRYVETSQP